MSCTMYSIIFKNHIFHLTFGGFRRANLLVNIWYYNVSIFEMETEWKKQKVEIIVNISFTFPKRYKYIMYAGFCYILQALGSNYAINI